MRIKDVVTLRNEKTTDNTMSYIALDNIISWDAKYVESNTETEGTNSIFKKGDVLFGKLRPYLAKGFCPTYDGICSTEFFVMTPNKGFSSRFLLYYFLSVPFIDYIKNQVAGVKMPRTKWDDFGSISINIPSFDEQQRIVDYLDKKLTTIDHRVEVLEKEKEAYARLKKSVINQAVTRGLNPNVALKDSGIDWIGMIPEHWTIERYKTIFSLINGNGFKIEYQGEESGQYPFMKVSDLNGKLKKVNSASNYVSDEIVESESYNVIPALSILFPKIGEALKKNHRKINTVSCCIDNNCSALVGKKRICIDYYYYVLLCVDMSWYDNNGTVPCINTKMLMSSCLLFPPLSEQQAIADYLDEKCAKIDAAIENIRKQIDASKRLKKAIINEAISGKLFD